jgi:hypothetical protein
VQYQTAAPPVFEQSDGRGFMMKTVVVIGIATMCVAALSAQTQETKTTTRTKVETKGGKDTRVVGCIERGAGGDYTLTRVRGGASAPSQYALISSDDLSKHVGHRMEIHGKAVMNGKGKVVVESTTKTEADHGKDQESKSKLEGTAGVLDMPVLGVKSMKMISSSCS